METDEEGDNLVSVEILNTETGQLVPGPDMPQYSSIAAAAVNKKLLVFARRIEGDHDIGEIHALETGQPNPTWATTSFTLPTEEFINESNCYWRLRSAFKEFCVRLKPRLLVAFANNSIQHIANGHLSVELKLLHSQKMTFTL